MKTLEQTYTINSSLEKVWQTLVDPKEIAAWGAGPAVMDAKKGSEFKLWGGDIWGKNLEVILQKKLVQEWYGGDWPEPSKVTFTFKDLGDNKTQVNLLHENLPNEEASEFEQGWKDYYLGDVCA